MWSNESEPDVVLKQHLAMLLIGVQSGEDADVLRLARSETHRLVGAVLACLRVHVLTPSGSCATCGLTDCLLRKEIGLALLPVRPALPDGG
jgi:hypothetical protein